MLCERVRAEITPGKFQTLSKRKKKTNDCETLELTLFYSEKTTNGLATAASSGMCACPPAAKHLVGTCQTIVTNHQGKLFDVGLHQNDRQQRHLF